MIQYENATKEAKEELQKMKNVPSVMKYMEEIDELKFELKMKEQKRSAA